MKRGRTTTQERQTITTGTNQTLFSSMAIEVTQVAIHSAGISTDIKFHHTRSDVFHQIVFDKDGAYRGVSGEMADMDEKMVEKVVLVSSGIGYTKEQKSEYLKKIGRNVAEILVAEKSREGGGRGSMTDVLNQQSPVVMLFLTSIEQESEVVICGGDQAGFRRSLYPRWPDFSFK
ncbi:unnamed protein product [Lactuca saligna]|uniref:Uncharacterized protein n=1 Tax=Lactuca saligna TaxID=75948 RepID=A0AA35ZGN4_LACSI|nr:unnamed protein product [Lactuca saligna]